jgi:hypothetical protein
MKFKTMIAIGVGTLAIGATSLAVVANVREAIPKWGRTQPLPFIFRWEVTGIPVLTVFGIGHLVPGPGPAL